MSHIYFSSDLHLNHDRDFIYKPRGFQTVNEMNEAIITRFNEVIEPDDTLYLLGDIMLGDAETAQLLFARLLKCRTYVVYGNHDTAARIEFYYSMYHCKSYPTLTRDIWYNGWRFILSHYPMLVGGNESFKKRKLVNLSGHTHSRDKFAMMDQGIYNVAVDAHDCYPVDIDTIIKDIKAYQKW